MSKRSIAMPEGSEPGSALELRLRQEYPHMKEVHRRLSQAVKSNRPPLFKDFAEAEMFCLRVALSRSVPQKILRLSYLLETLLAALKQTPPGYV
jgi:hypothetical protein